MLMDHAPVADVADVAEVTSSAGTGPPDRCPFPHGTTAAPVTTAATAGAPAERGGCPVLPSRHGGQRSPADLVVRRLLRIEERPAGLSAATAYRTFQRSMLISATRCTLTYVVFPFLLPFLHVLKGGAPVIGVVIGTVALVCDTFTIRRFFVIDHKWRWPFSTVVLAIMGLLAVLLVQDVSHIVGNLTG